MKIIKILLFLLFIQINGKEIQHIFQTKPWTAIVPIYGDKQLKRLNEYLVQNKQKIDVLKNLNALSAEDICEMKNDSNSVIRKDLWLVNNLVPHIRAHRNAALFHSFITLGSLFTMTFLFYAENTYCTGNINECDYSIDKTIPLTFLGASLPFFCYKFFLEPDIVAYEKDFAELIKKLRND